MRVIVNGESHDLPEATTVRTLIESLHLKPELVAVQLNETIVPRHDHRSAVLEAGDRVELIRVVGGG